MLTRLTERIGSFSLTLFLICTTSVALACTGITLRGDDGTIVRARTLEWGSFDLKAALDIVPRGYRLSAQEMPDGKAGLSWTAKYGFVGTTGLGRPLFADGLNEKGLSAGLFYLPGFAEYKPYDAALAATSMGPTDLVGYILAQFETLDEVRNGLADIHVVALSEPALGFPAPIHVIVTDPTGKSIVIEPVDQTLKIHDAPLGVITNSPTYDWHVTNLRNYLNLSAISLPEKNVDGIDFKPLGAGSGMIGLPGDFTPPSRFVRAVAFSKTARNTSGGYDTVRESFRILDNFNVPAAAAEGTGHGAGPDDKLLSATQFTTAADLTNLVFYYHTQFSRRVRMIDLKKIDFGKIGDKIISRPLDTSREEDILEVQVGAAK
ncbi:MAG: choloylglycine hydrolase family protein [Pseudomonadota bacterium]